MAIWTTPAFDVATADPATVRFGPSEAAPVHPGLEDLDGDGDADLVLHFKVQETGIACGDTGAQLTGATFGGQEFEGSDTIRTAGCG